MTVGQKTKTQDEEYQSILGAVMETPRGRWFIEEFTRRNRTADTNELLNAINALASTANGNAPETIDVLRRELQEMSASIQHTRSEISAIKPDDANENRITAATEQLDAILIATERATSEILTSAERIQEISENLREQNVDDDLCDELESHATGIFMACSFQDITGQRTTKVVQVLQYLEHRIDSMIQIWGSTDGAAKSSAPVGLNGPGGTEPDTHLENGPQLEEVAPSQDTIDDIFAQSPYNVTDAPGEETSGAAPDGNAGPKTENPREPATANGHVNLDDLEFSEVLPNETANQNDIDSLFD